MLRSVDRLLDNITMYRLLLYYLIGLLLTAMVLGRLGHLPYGPQNILLSTSVLVAACWVINKAFALILKAPTNYESSLITALILALIISPAGSGLPFMLAASGLAMASKYLLTINRKHLFNPAAVAVTLTALGPQQSASWWVGTAVMLPFVLIGGVLIVRKIRRTAMVVAFLGSAFVADAVYVTLTHGIASANLKDLILNSALFFLAFVMLTEPLTSPVTRGKQIWYGVLVGALFPPQAHLLSLYSTPERALIVGNLFAYIVSPKTKLFPALKKVVKISPNALDFIFESQRHLAYEPGQYMEWTLPHDKTDSRGNRRYFTLASSPTENDLRLGIKFYKNGSSYKRAMLAMTPQTPIVAAQVSGDFVMPEDASRKLAFIAGGIGITPYRSMIKYLIDREQKRDVVLLYSARSAEEITYRDVFEEAHQKLGLKTVYTLTDEATPLPDTNYRAGYITSEVIKAEIPDYQDRTFYLSGTHDMVTAMREALTDLGIHHSHIKTDFFPGYA
jgi:ferredoxin-NADP reductase/Na+-translocating ferredoxin:NAD+ oxidoreductase RnfD subunit